MRRVFAFMLGALAALTSHAADIEPARGAIGVHTISWHDRRDYAAENYYVFGYLVAQRREAFCEVNPGLYYRAAAGFTIGAYRNSFCQASPYAGWTWETDSKRWWITAGVVKYNDWRPMLAMGPAFRLDKDLGLESFGPTTVRIGWLPGVRRNKRECPPQGCLVWPTFNGGQWPQPKATNVITVMVEREF